MPIQYTRTVMHTLAQYLGVPARAIAPAHDLRRDWGLTPLALVVILLDLERCVALELPCEELRDVRTVSDLTNKFRLWARAAKGVRSGHARRPASALKARRLRRELHHLRWLEHNAQRRQMRLMARVA